MFDDRHSRRAHGFQEFPTTRVVVKLFVCMHARAARRSRRPCARKANVNFGVPIGKSTNYAMQCVALQSRDCADGFQETRAFVNNLASGSRSFLWSHGECRAPFLIAPSLFTLGCSRRLHDLFIRENWHAGILQCWPFAG